MKSVSIEEARAGLGDLVDRARLVGEPTLITRYGRPAAVVVGADWFRKAAESLSGPAGAINVPSGADNDQ